MKTHDRYNISVIIKKLAALVLAAAMLVSCGAAETPSPSVSAPVESVSAEPSETPSETPSEEVTATPDISDEPEIIPEFREFTDDLGRTVTLPGLIDSYAPVGDAAQLLLFSVNPDKLAGLSAGFSQEALNYMPKRMGEIAVFGSYSALDHAALIAAAPDFVLVSADVGSAELDALQAQLGIPVVYLNTDLNLTNELYSRAGELTGELDRCATLSAYTSFILNFSADLITRIGENTVSVYWADGEDGLSPVRPDGLRDISLSLAGVTNAVPEDAAEISAALIAEWNPGVIICETADVYALITQSEEWLQVPAVAAGRVYRIPPEPLGFMDEPMAQNRLIGIYWLTKICYPDLNTLQVYYDIRTFFDILFGISFSEEKYYEFMQNGMTEGNAFMP
jgi:iron complex transport system substrate-binding protein